MQLVDPELGILGWLESALGVHEDELIRVLLREAREHVGESASGTPSMSFVSCGTGSPGL